MNKHERQGNPRAMEVDPLKRTGLLCGPPQITSPRTMEKSVYPSFQLVRVALCCISILLLKGLHVCQNSVEWRNLLHGDLEKHEGRKDEILIKSQK